MLLHVKRARTLNGQLTQHVLESFWVEEVVRLEWKSWLRKIVQRRNILRRGEVWVLLLRGGKVWLRELLRLKLHISDQVLDICEVHVLLVFRH
jgi:hypothetical protein